MSEAMSVVWLGTTRSPGTSVAGSISTSASRWRRGQPSAWARSSGRTCEQVFGRIPGRRRDPATADVPVAGIRVELLPTVVPFPAPDQVVPAEPASSRLGAAPARFDQAHRAVERRGDPSALAACGPTMSIRCSATRAGCSPPAAAWTARPGPDPSQADQPCLRGRHERPPHRPAERRRAAGQPRTRGRPRSTRASTRSTARLTPELGAPRPARVRGLDCPARPRTRTGPTRQLADMERAKTDATTCSPGRSQARQAAWERLDAPIPVPCAPCVAGSIAPRTPPAPARPDARR